MFTNKNKDGTNNICGKNISYFRTKMGISQRALADKMQLVEIDIDKNAIQLTDKNLSKIAAKGRVKTKIQDIKDFVVPEKAIVVCNPPYGERLLDIKNAEEIYKTMGKVFEKRDGVNYYIISPHEDFESFFGRKATKKRKLYNGMIKCNLYMYF